MAHSESVSNGDDEDESVYALSDEDQAEVDGALEELDSAVALGGTDAMVRSAKLLALRIRKEANELPLERWQEELCDWMASQEKPNLIPPKDLRTVAMALAGRAVTSKAIHKLRASAQWRMRWERRRQSLLSADLSDAREKAIGIVGKGVQIMDEMLDQVREDRDVRGATPLVLAAFDRALPKKTESTTVATQITVNLTPEQAAGLNGPIMVVEAVETVPLPPETQ